jgi:hypothetical protein
MAILIVGVIVVVAVVAVVVYGAATQPCENGFHRHRHWRFKRFRPGGCSAVD